MDGSKRTLFLIVSLCVFLAALGVSSARLVTRYSGNLQKAQSAFQTLRSAASRALTQSGPSDEAWRTTAKRLYQNDDSVLMVALHAPGQGVLHMVPRSAPYLAGSPDARSVDVELLYPPQTVSRLSAVVGTVAGIPVTLDVLYSLLRQRDVYEAARLGLMIAAAWTALSLLVVTVAGLRTGPARYVPAFAKAPASSKEVRPSEAGNQEPGIFDEDFNLPEIPFEPTGGEYPSSASLPDIQTDNAIPEQTRDGFSSASSPKGLYSPTSGLGWEEYLAERLSAELSRAASFEQDLVLLRLSHEGISRDSSSFRMIIKTLLSFFSFRDMAFEQGPSGFAVILPNMDSDHALRMAEEFLKKITALLRNEGKSQDYLKVFLGLSSRSGRLVDADRLIKEAQAALARAREEADSRIVAFKADPNKYRAYLAARQ